MKSRINVLTALLVALLCINSVTGSDLSVFADAFATPTPSEEQTCELAPDDGAVNFEEDPDPDETTEDTSGTDETIDTEPSTESSAVFENEEVEPAETSVTDETTPETEETEATEVTESADATEPSAEETEPEVTVEPSVTAEPTAEPTAAATEEPTATATSTPTSTPAISATLTAEVTATPVPTEQVRVKTLEKTISASDGNNYKIKVTYDTTMGIPDDSELDVKEIKPSDTSYDEYVDKSAEVAGCESRVKDFVCAFDISIKDKTTGVHIEPSAAVKVEIKILNDSFNEEADIKVVHFGDEVELVESDAGKNTIAFETDGFSVFVVSGYTLEQFIEAGDGNTYKVKVTYDDSAALSENVMLKVEEIPASDPSFKSYEDQTISRLGLESVDYMRLFDISIVDKNDPSVLYQPKSAVNVDIELIDGSDISKEYKVLHFGSETEQLNVTADGPKVSFETTGFSAYAIVQGVSGNITYEQIQNIADFESHLTLDNGKPRPFLIGHKDGAFFSDNQIAGVGGTNNRNGIEKVKGSVSNPPAGAAEYYFESTGTANKYYIYCLDENDNRKYLNNGGNSTMSNSGNNCLYFTDSTSPYSEFTLANGTSSATFTLQGKGGGHINQQGGNNGVAFAAYNGASDPNAQLCFVYSDSFTEDPYGLDGKSYSIGYCDSNSGVALQAGPHNALFLPAVYAKEDRTDIVYIPFDLDASAWTFSWQGKNKYYISTVDQGQTQYLTITSEGVTMSDTPSIVKYVPGTGANSGKFKLESDGYSVLYTGKVSTGFTTDSSNSTYLSFIEPTEMIDEYIVTYSAKKVSISDRDLIPNGAQVIVYTRIWNDSKKEYEFYAIDYDGSLHKVYERADEIQWVGSQINTLLWDFTEYYYEGTNKPNNYYELQNVYSEQYLAPQIQDNQILSDDKIGINMSGRRDGAYYSEITAWDNKYYSYAGIKTSGTDEVVSCPRTRAETFYFAVMTDTASDELNTVDTLNNADHGITMKIVDFSKDPSNSSSGKEPTAVLGNSNGGLDADPTKGLLSTYLGEDGYPVAKNGSFAKLFDEEEAKTAYDLDVYEADKLFIASTYEASGYYEFDSTQDYAVFQQEDGTFKVYHQLGSSDIKATESMKHGQFFPFDDLTENKFSTKNQNLYSAEAKPLSDDDPRKYERLYCIDNPNYFFGVELDAGFVQTPSGHDAWGHDIIYEFTGDDDFWLYVDGELVIDLGGVHSALSGKVNFCTGQVEVCIDGKRNKKKTNLRTIFEENYRARNMNATQADVDAYLNKFFEPGENVFRDYSSHTMKIFYMERGAGASNLHMRFNLSSVKPGQILLSKEISGTDEFDFNLAEFAYQIYYQLDGSDEFVLLDNGTEGHLNVKYQNSSEEVKYKARYTPAGATTAYDNVFFISPGRPIAISVPDSTINYKIVECGVNPSIYDVVKVNDSTTGISWVDNGTRRDYTLAQASVEERPNAVFDNHVKEGAVRTLTVTKELYDETGTNRITDDPQTFDYRLYLAREDEVELKPADMVKYSVRDENQEYCRWDADAGFVSIGKVTYSSLTDTEKELVTFESSPNGAISRIPAGYSIEVRNLLVGTHFKIEERSDEIPEGYQLMGYERVEGSFTFDDEHKDNCGFVRENSDPALVIKNKRGWGLTVQKQWSDAEFTVSHDPVYVAIYNNGTLVPGTVRKLDEATNSTYYFFDDLPSDAEFDQYESREVLLTGDFTVDAEGNVSGYDTIKIIDEEPFKLNAVPLGSTESKEFSYVAEYEPGDATGSSSSVKNVRTDVITNTRGGGIVMRLKDNLGNNLKDGVFTLSKIENNVAVPVGDAKYTTGKNGRITILYDFEYETDYVLTQTASPRGYQGIKEPVRFRIAPDNTVTYTTNNPAGLATVEEVLSTEDNLIAYVTIVNYPFTLKVIKTDEATGDPLPGAHFAIYRQVKGVAGPIMDKNPLAGFEDIVSDGNGIIEDVDQTLAPRTYYLKETKAPLNYIGLDDVVVITIDSLGFVTIDGAHAGTLTENKTTSPFGCDYTIEVTNEHEPGKFNLTVEKNVTGAGDRTAQFEFTLDDVVGGVDGAKYDYIKTAADGTETIGKISKSETFTLAHTEHIVISFPENVTVTISEDHGSYKTTWKVDDDTPVEADSATVVLDDDKTILVTNHIDSDVIPPPTGVTFRNMPMLLMLVGSMTVLCLVFIDRKRRKGRSKIRKVTKKMLKGVV